MKMRSTCRCIFTIALALSFAPVSLFAARLAFDKASDPAYDGVWTNGSNGGVGWTNGGWEIVADSFTNATTHFVASSTNNNASGDTNTDGDIDTAGRAWGLQGDGQGVFAVRYFDGPLTNGQRFVIFMDNGAIEPGGYVEFRLQNEATAATRFHFKLTGGDETYDLESIGTATGITNTTEGLKVEVEMVDSDTVNVLVTKLVDGTTYPFNGIPLADTGNIISVSLVCNFAGAGVTNQAFFNSIAILPDTNDPAFFADLSVDKAVSLDPAIINSNLTYSITVTNNGPADATVVTVTDTLPDGVTFVSADSPQGTCATNDSGQVICEINLLASNATATVDIVVTPNAAGILTNIASVSALNVDSDTDNNAVTNIIDVLDTAVLSVSPASLDFGIVATGTISQLSLIVSNLGGATLIGTATVSGVGFDIDSGSPFSLDPLDSTNIVVNFTPLTEGDFTGSVVFASNDGVSTNEVTGVGAIAPVADFTGTPTAGLAPLLVTFDDISTGTITNRFWDFGDGGTTNTTSTNVVYEYLSDGTFDVTLIVSGPLGVSTNTQLGYIIVTNIPPELATSPPSHDFGLLEVGQTSTQEFLVINNGVGALSGTATVSGVSFDLVDGSPFNVSGGATGSVNVSFSPGSADAFTGSVVFASDGGVSTNTLTGSGAVAPVADFTANPTNGAAPLVVDFTDASTGTITNRLWDFGDSGTSTATSPSHTYSNAGTFSVTLTVFGPLGSNTLTLSDLVTVTNVVPVAGFGASPTNGGTPLLVTFTDASTGTITNQLWNFGDSGTSTLASPTHTYTTAGVFSVSLTVFGPEGTDTLTLTNLIAVTNVVSIPPTVSIQRPATGMVYPPTNAITIVAVATASNGLDRIEFFANGTKLSGDGTLSPATKVFSNPLTGSNTLRVVAFDDLGLSTTSTPVHVIVGVKNSPLGDWEVTIGGLDKGLGFLTFSDDATATGYGIRLGVFGLNDVSGQWGINAKGQVTGPFMEQLGASTNWTGTLTGKATSLKKFSGSVVTNSPAFKWKGVPATDFPNLGGTWTGTVTVKALQIDTNVAYIVTANPDNSGVFDMAAANLPGTVVGQLIVTSRGKISGYLTFGPQQMRLSGKFKASQFSLSLSGTNEDGEKVKINLFLN